MDQNNTIAATATIRNGRFVAVGGAGTVWTSSDGFATFQLHYAGSGVGDLYDVVQTATSKPSLRSM